MSMANANIPLSTKITTKKFFSAVFSSPLRAVLFVVALGAFTRMILYQDFSLEHNDSKRFVSQALMIVNGEPIATWLPPGYPLFLAAIYELCGTFEYAPLIQVLLAELSLALLAILTWRNSGVVTLLIPILISVNPWIADYNWQIMSEGFAVSLATYLLCFFLFLTNGRDKPLGVEAIGSLVFAIVSMILVLVTPSTIFLCFGLVFWMIWQKCWRVVPIVSVVLGAFVTMGIWQFYVYQSEGHFAPLILTTKQGNLTNEKAVVTWMKSYQVWPTPPWKSAYGLFVWESRDLSLDDLPSYAFEDEKQKYRVAEHLEIWRIRPESGKDKEKFFLDLAEKQISDSPVRYYVVMPVLRSIALWVYMPQVKHAQVDYLFAIDKVKSAFENQGPVRAIQRGIKVVLSWPALFIHIAYTAIFLLSFSGNGSKDDRLGRLVILTGIIGYTLVTSWIGLNESRRNLPFIPFLIFLGITSPVCVRCMTYLQGVLKMRYLTA